MARDSPERKVSKMSEDYELSPSGHLMPVRSGKSIGPIHEMLANASNNKLTIPEADESSSCSEPSLPDEPDQAKNDSIIVHSPSEIRSFSSFMPKPKDPSVVINIKKMEKQDIVIPRSGIPKLKDDLSTFEVAPGQAPYKLTDNIGLSPKDTSEEASERKITEAKYIKNTNQKPSDAYTQETNKAQYKTVGKTIKKVFALPKSSSMTKDSFSKYDRRVAEEGKEDPALKRNKKGRVVKITETKIKRRIDSKTPPPQLPNPQVLTQTEPVEFARKVDTCNQEIQIEVADPDVQERLDFLNELASEKNRRLAAKYKSEQASLVYRKKDNTQSRKAQELRPMPMIVSSSKASIHAISKENDIKVMIKPKNVALEHEYLPKVSNAIGGGYLFLKDKD